MARKIVTSESLVQPLKSWQILHFNHALSWLKTKRYGLLTTYSNNEKCSDKNLMMTVTCSDSYSDNDL